MPFTGKSTFTAGADLPEVLEDVSDIVGIVSPFETPLLDHLGDPRLLATSTVHEWLEDALLPNTDNINQSAFTPNATTATSITVDNGDRFQVGDQVRPEGSKEILFVTAISGNDLTVVRAYGGTKGGELADDQKLTIVGNAALEGADRPATRFTQRVRRANYTQIFTAGVEVSGSMQAARLHGVSDELDYQKQARLRELLRDLENTVINGVAASANPQGTTSVRRTMNGLLASIKTNVHTPGDGVLQEGGGDANNELNESLLNAALRLLWERSAGVADTILVGGAQKRRINEFISSARAYAPRDERVRDLVNVYESDFGVARIVMSRYVPPDTMVLLDSSRIAVMPLSGRSFHFKPLASSGDSEVGQVIGEYTLEIKNENAHMVVNSLATE